jgi:hypothetical protein
MGVLNPDIEGATKAGKADKEFHGDKGLYVAWLRNPSSQFSVGVARFLNYEKTLGCES